ncbi:MAG TPA: transposase [Bacteroidetes bacterium]|nr:transposase [Bacteroidota bacterium]
MFTITSTQKFQLYTEATDMRKSFDGLSGLVKDFIEALPVGSPVFVFINKKRDKIKILHWEGNGYLLYYKRLEEGTFELPRYEIKQSLIQLSYTQMVMLIDGVSILNIHKRKRYLQSKKSI